MDSLSKIINQKNIEIIKDFLDKYPQKINDKNSYNFSALDEAISIQFAEGALLLIKKGIDVDNINSNGDCTIHLAVKFGLPNVIKAILMSKKSVVNELDKHGNNALWTALFNARLKPDIYFPIVEILLEYGANPYNKNNAGRTPLYILEIATEPIRKKIYELNDRYHFIK